MKHQGKAICKQWMSIKHLVVSKHIWNLHYVNIYRLHAVRKMVCELLMWLCREHISLLLKLTLEPLLASLSNHLQHEVKYELFTILCKQLSYWFIIDKIFLDMICPVSTQWSEKVFFTGIRLVMGMKLDVCYMALTVYFHISCW